MTLDRVVPSDDDTLAAVAIGAVLSLPPDLLRLADTVAVLTGQGEDQRVSHGAWLRGRHDHITRLWIAEGNPAERTHRRLDAERLAELGVAVDGRTRVQQAPAPHTGHQADWIAATAARERPAGIAVCVSPYHLPRAYLTVLNALLRRGIRIPVVPAPVPVPPATVSPETGAAMHDLLAGEAQRIVRYTAAGWLTGGAELRDHLDRLWRRAAASSS